MASNVPLYNVIFFILLLGGWLSSHECYGQKLYLFSQGDVHDEDVGDCVKAGIDEITRTVKYLMPSERLVCYNDPDQGDDKSEELWTGPDISMSYNIGDDILEAIERCPAGSKDSIFCYWCGHGAFDEGGHFLWLPEGRGRRAIRRAEILDALKRKNVRLVTLITESCHIKQSFPDEEGVSGSSPPATIPSPITPLFSSLFFDCHGIVDINSSSPEQISIAHQAEAGVFTRALCEFFSEHKQMKLTWREMIKSIDRMVALDPEADQRIYVWRLPTERLVRSGRIMNDQTEAAHNFQGIGIQNRR